MRYTVLRLILFGLYYTYLKDTAVNGAITMLSHKKTESESPPDDKEEPGFDLDEREIKKFHIWPNGIIPYHIDDFSFDKVLRDKIRVFLDHTSRMTGLQFLELPRPPTDDSRWVFFINRQGLLGCADQSFWKITNEGVQKILLGYDCITNYGFIQIVLILVGVPPQHNSPDRDDFIQIRMDNIMPDKRYFFNKLKDDEWLFHDLEYDYKSAGHYDSHKFTANGGATITSKDDSVSTLEIGFKTIFSTIDIKKIRMLYNFISKKRAVFQLPECSKMFYPGSNFSNYHENKQTKGKPRNKPKKYLGFPEKAIEDAKPNGNLKNINNTNKNVTPQQTIIDKTDDDEEEVEEHENLEKEDVETDVEKVIEDNARDDNLKEEDDISDNQSLSKNEDVGSVTAAVSETSKTILKAKKNNTGQSLLDLSDFATGENL